MCSIIIIINLNCKSQEEKVSESFIGQKMNKLLPISFKKITYLIRKKNIIIRILPQ